MKPAAIPADAHPDVRTGTVVLPFGARHLDAGLQTLCGRYIVRSSLRQDAARRVSCRECLAAEVSP